MKYNFDTTPDHKTNASFRWGMADMPSDVIGMGTADLDYYCAPCIRETLLPIAEETATITGSIQMHIMMQSQAGINEIMV